MANQILAGAVINAGTVIAGVDADNPPYVGLPPTPQNYFQASLSDWTIVAGSVTQPTSGTFAWTRSGGDGWVAGYEISGLTAGTEYTISYEIRNPNGGSTIDALVSTVLAGGTWLSRQSTESSDFVTFTSTWTQPNQTTAYLNILSDHNGESGEIRSVSIVALIPNEPPVISGIDASYTLTEGQDTVISVVTDDADGDTVTLTYAVTAGDLAGTTISRIGDEFTVTPGSQDTTFQLTFTADDSLGKTETAVADFTYDYNSAPVISGIGASYTLVTGEPTTITGSATDAEGQAITWSYIVTSGALAGSTVSQADNVFTVTPGSEDATFQLTFTATDAGGKSTSSASDFTHTYAAPAPAPEPATDTISSLHINGTDSGIVDSSTNSYSVNSYGDVSVVDVSPYSTGKSMTFDGNGDYLNVPSEMNFGTEDFTFEGWYYLTGDRATFLSGSQNGSYDFVYVSNSIRIGRVNTAWDQIINHTLTQNTWQHIAFVRSSGTLSVYVDGNLIGAETNDNNYFSGPTVWIGQNFLDGGDGRRFSGNMSDVRIVTGEAVYTENFSVPTSPLGVTETPAPAPAPAPSIVTEGLVFYVDAGDTSSYSGSGTTWSDLSGNGVNGTLVNGPTYSSDDGGKIVFDNSNDYVNFSSPSVAFGDGDFAMEIWVKFTSAPDQFDQIMQGRNPDATGVFWGYRHGNLDFVNNNDSYPLLRKTWPTQNEWTHLVLTRDASKTVSLYRNGILDDGTIYNAMSFGQTEISIGSSFGYNVGREVGLARLYVNKGLSADEVVLNYNDAKSRFGH